MRRIQPVGPLWLRLELLGVDSQEEAVKLIQACTSRQELGTFFAAVGTDNTRPQNGEVAGFAEAQPLYICFSAIERAHDRLASPAPPARPHSFSATRWTPAAPGHARSCLRAWAFRPRRPSAWQLKLRQKVGPWLDEAGLGILGRSVSGWL